MSTKLKIVDISSSIFTPLVVSVVFNKKPDLKWLKVLFEGALFTSQKQPEARKITGPIKSLKQWREGFEKIKNTKKHYTTW